jgi:hypothetical protein
MGGRPESPDRGIQLPIFSLSTDAQILEAQAPELRIRFSPESAEGRYFFLVCCSSTKSSHILQPGAEILSACNLDQHITDVEVEHQGIFILQGLTM